MTKIAVLAQSARMRDRVDEPADGEIVVGDHRLRRHVAGARAAGVVAREAHDLELRQRARALVRVELALPLGEAVDVADVHVERREARSVLRAQRVVGDRDRRRFAGPGRDELAVVAQRDAVRDGVVPQIAGVRHGGFGAVLEVVQRAAVGVVGRPHLLEVVVGERGGRPVVAVGADVRVLEEAVEHAEALRERVLVGRDVRAEQHELRIAVGARDVAEHLIVRAVLLDHVDDVADRAAARTTALGGDASCCASVAHVASPRASAASSGIAMRRIEPAS